MGKWVGGWVGGWQEDATLYLHVQEGLDLLLPVSHAAGQLSLVRVGLLGWMGGWVGGWVGGDLRLFISVGRWVGGRRESSSSLSLGGWVGGWDVYL